MKQLPETARRASRNCAGRPLSPRMEQIMRLVVELRSASIKDIAAHISLTTPIAVKTVGMHLDAIHHRLGVHTQIALYVRAIELGYGEPPRRDVEILMTS